MATNVLQHCCKRLKRCCVFYADPRSNLSVQQIRLQGCFSSVVKRATSLFNSYGSKDITKQVGRFLLPVLPYLIIEKKLQTK